MDAKRFFETAVPYLIVRSMLAFMASKGTIQFSVEGQGCWTVQLGNIDQPTASGLIGKPDLQVWFSAAAFSSFLSGTMNPIAAIRSGDLRATGQTQLLERFGRLLLPPKNTTGFRMAMA